MNVGVLGLPISSGNLGIHALATALVAGATRISRDARFTLFSSHHCRTVHRVECDGFLLPVGVVNIRWNPVTLYDHYLVVLVLSISWALVPLPFFRDVLKRRVPWIKAMASSDIVVDVRGGDSFSDTYGLWRLLEGSIPAISCILLGRPLVQMPQTFGPFRGFCARIIAGYILRSSEVVLARDQCSGRVASALGHGFQVLVYPDIAFALDSYKPKEKFPQRVGEHLTLGSLIGLNVNGLVFNSALNGGGAFDLTLNYRGFWVGLINQLLNVCDHDLLLIPHTWAAHGHVESDNDACEELLQSVNPNCRHRIHILSGSFTAHEIKWVIGRCEFLVAGRMHACIAGLSQGVPTIGVAYSSKFRGVFETVGMEDWVVDGREVQNDEAISTILAKYADSDSVRPGLLKAADKARADLDTLFRSLVDGTLIPKREVR